MSRSLTRIDRLPALVLVLVLVLAAGCSAPQHAPADHPSSETSVTSAPGGAGDPFPVLASPAEQARMQAYADNLYDRRFVRASFADRGGTIFDCVDFDQQPSCRNGGCPHVPPTPPTPPGPPGGAPGARPGEAPRAAVATGASCPDGTIGIARPRLEIMRHFRTLEDWQRGGKGAPPHP